ncbi:DUF1573 domain-containing protein [Niabella sp. 22666]|uniref:DUF1573 domain-containing protein n=1 Tax=Niabella sp. 22666 TaxID=3453954 RepID=UPI003F8403F7
MKYIVMNRFLFFTLVCAGLLLACGNNKSKEDADKTSVVLDSSIVKEPVSSDTIPMTSINWMDSTFKDIGILKGKDSATITYRFKNTGDKPLVIQSIKTSCGCTVADSLKEPILPGKESFLRVKFYAADQAVATHEKHVYVTSNTKPHNGSILTFKVEVKE